MGSELAVVWNQLGPPPVGRKVEAQTRAQPIPHAADLENHRLISPGFRPRSSVKRKCPGQFPRKRSGRLANRFERRHRAGLIEVHDGVELIR